MKLETIKEENKQKKESFMRKKRQQDENHKIMVNMRRDIKRVKEFSKKMKERQKKKDQDFFEEIDDHRIHYVMIERLEIFCAGLAIDVGDLHSVLFKNS